MSLGDVDRCLEGRRYSPVDGKETDEGPEEQSSIYENTDPEDVQAMNHFTVVGMIAMNRRGQLSAPFLFF